MINSIMTATGSYIPEIVVNNSHFNNYNFFTYDEKSESFISELRNGKEIADIYANEKGTGVIERRHVRRGIVTSDIATTALLNTNYDLEKLDLIILAHNFGDYSFKAKQGEAVSNLSSRVKQKAKIKNPKTEARDILAGCPGWLAGLDFADSIIKAGKAKSIAVIGAETLSYFSDPHDKNSTIYSDGAGAIILEARKSNRKEGILSYAGITDAEKSHLLSMKQSINNQYNPEELFLRMLGPKVYTNAVKYVPKVIAESIEKAGYKIPDINMFLGHQANERLDIAILQRVLYNGALKSILKGLSREKTDRLLHMNALIHKLAPLTINKLGNSSVATIPILLDLVRKGDIDKFTINNINQDLPDKINELYKKLVHKEQVKEKEQIKYAIHPGDIINFFSVGAGMHYNSITYLEPEK